MAQPNSKRSSIARQGTDSSEPLPARKAVGGNAAGLESTLGVAANDDDERFLARTRRSVLLNRIVEAEVLPRLALARAAADKQAGRLPDRMIPEGPARTIGQVATAAPMTKKERLTTEGDTAELIRLLLGMDDLGAMTFVESLAARGAAPASLYLGIVTRAARRLGELWDEDRCDFAQVTISLGRLQQIVRALSPGFQTAAVTRSGHASTILLLPAPGEQHTIGLLILGEFFQREGWHVIGGPVSRGDDVVEQVRGGLVDVIGFSIGSVKCLDPLAACIRAVRKASRNRYLGVMVGGPLLLVQPDVVSRVGADATATDAPAAVRQANVLLTMQAAAD